MALHAKSRSQELGLPLVRNQDRHYHRSIFRFLLLFLLLLLHKLPPHTIEYFYNLCLHQFFTNNARITGIVNFSPYNSNNTAPSLNLWNLDLKKPTILSGDQIPPRNGAIVLHFKDNILAIFRNVHITNGPFIYKVTDNLQRLNVEEEINFSTCHSHDRFGLCVV